MLDTRLQESVDYMLHQQQHDILNSILHQQTRTSWFQLIAGLEMFFCCACSSSFFSNSQNIVDDNNEKLILRGEGL